MSFYLNGRRIVYTNQVPYETDILSTNDYNMAGVGGLSETVLGFGINNVDTVRGLPCTPAIVPTFGVVVGVGVMYSFQYYDETPYGVLPADINPNHRLYKQAFNFDNVQLELAAPITPGNSVIFLIEGIFDTVDVNDVSRPYFNSADPTLPIFEDNFDTRTDKIIFRARQGNESPSPIAPSPEAGYIGLYYVLVTYGQTSIIQENIAKVSNIEGQPFITEGLTQKISQATVEGKFVSIVAEQAATYVTGIDVGSVNNLVCNPTFPYSTPILGMRITVLVSNTNTASSTLTLSGGIAYNIKQLTESGLMFLTPSSIISGGFADLKFNGIDWVLLNATKPSSDSYVTIPDEQSATHVTGLDIGTTNAILCNPANPYPPLVAGSRITVFVQNSNTSAATFQLSGGLAHPIQTATINGLQNLIGGEMIGTAWADLKFNGVSWELLNPVVVGNYLTIKNEQQAYHVTAEDIGGINNKVANPNPAYPVSLDDGATITLHVNDTNTGPCTLQLNGGEVRQIKVFSPFNVSGVLAGQMVFDCFYVLKYNQASNVWVLINPSSPMSDLSSIVSRAGDTAILSGYEYVPFDFVIASTPNLALYDIPNKGFLIPTKGYYSFSATISLYIKNVTPNFYKARLFLSINSGDFYTLDTIYVLPVSSGTQPEIFTLSGSCKTYSEYNDVVRFAVKVEDLSFGSAETYKILGGSPDGHVTFASISAV